MIKNEIFRQTKQKLKNSVQAGLDHIKQKYEIDLEAIYDKFDNKLAYHNKEHSEAVLYYTSCFLCDTGVFRTYQDTICIAAYLHDVGHAGVKNKGKDYLNIKTAQDIISRVFRTSCLSKTQIDIIKKYISYTEFPYKDINSTDETDKQIADILRAADMCQIFIKDINVYELCYSLHYNENITDLQLSTVPDKKEFMTSQYNFYKSVADNNAVLKPYFDLYANEIFKEWL